MKIKNLPSNAVPGACIESGSSASGYRPGGCVGTYVVFSSCIATRRMVMLLAMPSASAVGMSSVDDEPSRTATCQCTSSRRAAASGTVSVGGNGISGEILAFASCTEHTHAKDALVAAPESSKYINI